MTIEQSGGLDVNIRGVTKLINAGQGTIENDINNEYYIVLKVSVPDDQGITYPPKGSQELPRVGVKVTNGMCWILTKEQADSVRHFTNE